MPLDESLQPIMTTHHRLIVCLTALTLSTGWSQQPLPPVAPPPPLRPAPLAPPQAPQAPQPPTGAAFNDRLRTIINQAAGEPAAPATKFSLDFPGGTPRQLVAAIEQAGGKPVNVILPDEHADAQLPPIKVNGVDLPQLFQTLLEASYQYAYNGDRREVVFSQGFTTTDTRPTEDSIWLFKVFKNRARFDLDFPGGRPRELVAAIEKATGRPLNAIVPNDLTETALPPLKMKDVDVVQLFDALQATSLKQEAYSTGTSRGGYGGGFASYQTFNSGYGFRTKGVPSDDSIWYFFVDRPPVPPSPPATKVCQFYALAPYIEGGVTVDDITTAIQTGWKLLGEVNPPNISFHKDTKLLIAVGEPGALETVEAVLRALKPNSPAPSPGVPAPAAKAEGRRLARPAEAPTADQ